MDAAINALTIINPLNLKETDEPAFGPKTKDDAKKQDQDDNEINEGSNGTHCDIESAQNQTYSQSTFAL